jgi:HSP20 family protein
MMATLPAQRQSRTLVPDLAELFTGSPWFAGLRPLFDRNFLRLEDVTKDNHYELRAEIPGIDPANDVDITVRDGVLTIKAVRRQKAEANGRSEFSYGAFTRSVPLPAGANADDITADYDKGILTVSVPVPDGTPVAKRIEVRAAN